MGTLGVGITSNDAAQDLKKDYQAAFSYYDVETALKKIDAYVRSDGYDESDESDWCDYYYSLANFMWKKGILTDKVRDTAVKYGQTRARKRLITEKRHLRSSEKCCCHRNLPKRKSM